MKVFELDGSVDAIKVALQNPKAIFCFFDDWNGEHYSHKYKFDKKSLEFKEVEINDDKIERWRNN